MPWLANSQTLSTEEYCTVPCRTLKNALVFKKECELVKGQLVVSRDSLYLLSNIVASQDTLVATQDSIILLYRENEVRYIGMLDNKDKIIEVKDKQIGLTIMELLLELSGVTSLVLSQGMIFHSALSGA